MHRIFRTRGFRSGGYRPISSAHRVILFSIALLTTGMLAGQTLFQKRFGTDFMDLANKAIETANGNYLVAGRSSGFGSSWNAILMELNTDGEAIWIRDYTGINADEIHDMLNVEGKDILVCGGTASQGAGGWDGFVMKLDSVGNMLWGRTYGNEFGDVLYKLKAYPDGGYLALGYAQSPAISGSQGTLLMKLDENGDVEWERYVLGGWTPQQTGWYPMDVEVLPDGDILLTTLNTGNGNHMNIWRVSPTGEQVWSRAYFVRSRGHRMAVDQAGNIYFTCLVYEGVALSVDMAILKLDGSGNVIWLKSYGGTYVDQARDIIVASDGSLVICGMTNSSGAGDYDAFLLKVDVDGVVQWCHTYGGVWPDISSSVYETQDNGFLMAGETYAYGTNADSLKMYVIRTDPMGLASCNSMEWPIIQLEGSVTNLAPMSLSNLPQQQGAITWPSNLRTFRTAPLCEVTGIDDHPDQTLHVTAYPNPFEGILQITSSQGTGGVLELRVLDMLGRVVYEYLGAASWNAWDESVDLGNLRSGVYLLEVRMDDRSTALRIVKE